MWVANTWCPYRYAGKKTHTHEKGNKYLKFCVKMVSNKRNTNQNYNKITVSSIRKATTKTQKKLMFIKSRVKVQVYSLLMGMFM